MTKPIDDLLPLSIEPAAANFLNLCHDAIHEIVCFGTHVLTWNLEQGRGKEDSRNEIDLVVPLFFRHTLELLDAIAIQIEKGAVVPCKAQLRAVIEAYLSLEYLLEKDRRRRAACMLITDHYRKLNFYKQFIPNSTDYTKLNEKLKKEGFILKGLSPVKDAVKGHNNQQKLINNTIYDDVRAEYLRLTKNNSSNFQLKWYSFFGGPSSVKGLAERLCKYDFYEFYYKPLSSLTHGTDLATKVLVKGDDGNGAIVQLRNMEDSQAITSQAMWFGLLIVSLMVNKTTPERKADYAQWFLNYKTTYREPVERIA